VESTPRTVVAYADPAGHEPFTDWLGGVRNSADRHRILLRLRRLEQGNFGDCKKVGSGVSELRLFFGPGYRVYYGQDGDRVIILLCGDNKGSQDKDIRAATAYWKEYKGR
jgi:putative addiction module killer protein